MYASIAYGVTRSFMRESNIWGTGIISCGFWFLMLNLIFALVINTAFLLVIGILYKKRKREIVLPNEQIFAKRFYSKQLGL